MQADTHPTMVLVEDLNFLRQDNENLLKEVSSLRLQSTLLRERSDTLERKLRGFLKNDLNRRESQADPPDLSVLNLDVKESKVSEVHLDISANLEQPSQVVIKDPEERIDDAPVEWFDDTPPQQEDKAKPEQLRLHLHFAPSGSHLIGEAPRATPDPSSRAATTNNPSRFSPPSPDPSETHSRIAVPSLLSVSAPVSGVGLPDVASSLLELKLIRKETYDSPAAVASFLHKLTQTTHTPQSTYRAAFTAAFLTLIPLLGPPGTLPTEWLNFLHDFPSRIPHTQRDSIVSIPWPPDASILTRGIESPGVLRPIPTSAARLYNARAVHRRSRSVDEFVRPPSTPDSPQQATPIAAPAKQQQSGLTGVPPCERDAWVLLLALSFAAFPSSRVAKKMRKLPIVVRLQMIAWLPPGVNIYANMHFVSMTVDEALGQFWEAKKEILRLKNRWPLST